MKKILVLLNLVLFCSLSASAEKHYHFGITDSNGKAFCNVFSVRLVTTGPTAKIADGTDDASGCGTPTPSHLAGLQTGVPANLQFNATGAALVLADDLLPGQALVWTFNIKANTWTLWENGAGQTGLGGFGFIKQF